MSVIKDFICSYIMGDSYGLSVLNNKDRIDDIKLQDNNYLNIKKGSMSSMSTFMLASMDSIIKNKKILPIDIINKMCTSLIVGKYTNEGKVYDLDKNTLIILEYYSRKNNLNINYNELDNSSYVLSIVIPIIFYNYYNEDNLDILCSIINTININEEVLFGTFIYYKYVLNLLDGKDKYKALKIDIPKGFSSEVKNKYKNILKNNIYYKDIKFDDSILNVISIVFYVILNTNSFEEIFNMLKHIEGKTNIYFSLICGIGGILYGKDDINTKLYKDLKNKRDINKYINEFERMFI